eukprot:1891017-Pleurochrysis_carterae.AAC.3
MEMAFIELRTCSRFHSTQARGNKGQSPARIGVLTIGASQSTPMSNKRTSRQNIPLATADYVRGVHQ